MKSLRSVSLLRLNQPGRAVLRQHSSGTLKGGVLAAALTLALIAAPAGAQTSALLPGLAFKAASAVDAACISVDSYARIKNTCSTPRLVAPVQVGVSGGITLSVVTNVFANNTWCQAVTTNGVGNGAFFTPQVLATGTGHPFQQLYLGNIDVAEGGALIERCELGPGDELMWVQLSEPIQ